MRVVKKEKSSDRGRFGVAVRGGVRKRVGRENG